MRQQAKAPTVLHVASPWEGVCSWRPRGVSKAPTMGQFEVSQLDSQILDSPCLNGCSCSSLCITITQGPCRCSLRGSRSETLNILLLDPSSFDQRVLSKVLESHCYHIMSKVALVSQAHVQDLLDHWPSIRTVPAVTEALTRRLSILGAYRLQAAAAGLGKRWPAGYMSRDKKGNPSSGGSVCMFG